MAALCEAYEVHEISLFDFGTDSDCGSISVSVRIEADIGEVVATPDTVAIDGGPEVSFAAMGEGALKYLIKSAVAKIYTEKRLDNIVQDEPAFADLRYIAAVERGADEAYHRRAVL